MSFRQSLWAIFSALIFTSVVVRAQVELPEEELAKETVVPRFDNSTTVKSRNVILDRKIELGVYYGWNFAEAIENQSKLGFNLGYHWNETSALFLNYALWQAGLNTLYTSTLQQLYQLDFTRAPQLQSSAWLNYEWDVFYGKISFTKQVVTNMSMYPIFGAGMTTYTNKSYPGVTAGIGTKFYFSSRWALRADFKLQYSGQPSPFLGNNALKTGTAVPSQNSFQDTYAIGSIFDIGVIALF